MLIQNVKIKYLFKIEKKVKNASKEKMTAKFIEIGNFSAKIVWIWAFKTWLILIEFFFLKKKQFKNL